MRADGLHARGDEEQRGRSCKLDAIAAVLSCFLPEVNNAGRQACHVGIGDPQIEIPIAPWMPCTHALMHGMPTYWALSPVGPNRRASRVFCGAIANVLEPIAKKTTL